MVCQAYVVHRVAELLNQNPGYDQYRANGGVLECRSVQQYSHMGWVVSAMSARVETIYAELKQDPERAPMLAASEDWLERVVGSYVLEKEG